MASPQKKSTATDIKPEGSVPGTSTTAVARCDLCRNEPFGCHLSFRSTSPVPEEGQEDAELHLKRGQLYKLMGKRINGVPVIQYSQLGGVRVMDGKSKCSYYLSQLNAPASKRGGNRVKKKTAKTPPPENPPLTSPIVQSPNSLVPPPPPATDPDTIKPVPPPPKSI